MKQVAALCVRVAFGWCSPERAGPLIMPHCAWAIGPIIIALTKEE
jgi:hypothetical protein